MPELSKAANADASHVVVIGAGFAVGVSLAVAVWFERWKAKQPDPEGK